VAAGTAITAAFFLLAVGAAWRAHRRGVMTGETALIGQTGRVVTWDGQRGFVHVHGEDWQAQSDAALAPGQAVRIASRRDLTLIVEPDSTSRG
jgi:membrane-bound serine protease (ClpP class)